jgi:hypothetical protein
MTQFFNATDKILQVKDAGGEVVVGPFLAGSREKGPWYNSTEVPEHYFLNWLATKKIEEVVR